ncbi:MAG TPA: TMEM43 family protein [Xanthomonadaceae bacterium]|nr:TMEM43 family protein [Xanthomonadaceae bacterium]
MSDRVTVVSRQGYFSRLGGAIKGILVGFLMFIVGFPVLFWNEGRAVQTRKSLDEGAGIVVSAQVTPRDAALDGGLVHLSGPVVVDVPPRDPRFGIEQRAIRLERMVEMYQWRETSETREEKKVGGSVERVTTYSYSKEWSSRLNDASGFQQPAGHQNPSSMPFETASFQAQSGTMGDYRLDTGVLGKVGGWSELTVQPADLAEDLREEFATHGEWLYRGANPGVPEVGDMRVRFRYVPEQTISVIARQSGDRLDAYPTQAGDSLLLVSSGDVSADHMFAQAHAANNMLTWILRFAGFMLMWIGLGLIFKPLSVLMDVIPLLGTIVGKGIGFVTFIIAAVLSLITIAIAWLFYRPLLGIALLIVAGGLIYWMVVKRKKPVQPPLVAEQPVPASS